MNGDGGKNFFNRGNFKIGLRHWTGTLIVAIVAGFVIFGLLRGQEFLASFLVGRETSKIQREFEKPYREDRYGGKTPEETFDLFLEALRKEDIDLASKYFELEKQERLEKSFEELKKSSAYNELLAEMEYARRNSRKVSENETVKFIYKVKVEESRLINLPDGSTDIILPGEYGAELVFQNIFGRWKIVKI